MSRNAYVAEVLTTHARGVRPNNHPGVIRPGPPIWWPTSVTRRSSRILVVTDWLIDKSALRKLPQSPDYEMWLDRINSGKVWAGVATKLEVAVSARDPQHWPTLRHHPRSG